MFSYHPQVLLMQCLSGKVVGLIYLHFDDKDHEYVNLWKYN